jgi:hypothetical protein
MVAIKTERGGGGKSKGGGGQRNNNLASQKKSGPLHPALFMSNKRMLEILRCDDADLDLLKHGAAKIVKQHPKVHHKELRWELSEQEPEWAQMLSGERWEGEGYPSAAGFEKDIEHVMIKIKSISTRKINNEKKKVRKQNGNPDDEEVKGGAGDSDGDGDSSGAGGGDAYMMSGGLGDETPAAQPRSPQPFRRLDWMHKNGQGSATRGSSHGENRANVIEQEEEEDIYGSTPPLRSRAVTPTLNAHAERKKQVRARDCHITPTRVSRHPDLHSNRMFGEEDDEAGFVGIFTAPPRGRAFIGGLNGTRRGEDTSMGRSREKTPFIDLCSDYE